MDNSSSNHRLAVELRDRLLADLRQNDTFRAYQHAEAVVLALSGEGAQVAQTKPMALPQNAVNLEKNDRRAFSPGTSSGRILTGAIEFLREKRGRARSGEILQALINRGIKIGGAKPRSTMASYLSHSPLFDNKPGEGYGLVEWSQPKTETPNSGELFGVPKGNGSSPLSL